MTGQERLRFAVKLARAPLQGLRPGDWQNLRDDFSRFIGYGEESVSNRFGMVLAVNEPPAPEVYGEDDFERLKSDINSVLTQLVKSREAFEGGRATTINAKALKLRKHQYAFNGHSLTFVAGTAHDLALEMLFALLAHEPIDRILFCPGCNQLFYRSGKRAYCTEACRNRTYWARYSEAKKRAARAATKRKRAKHR